MSIEEERDEEADNHGALMRYLLVVSTQTAMGRIQDGNNQNARSMALIRILLHCLKESGQYMHAGVGMFMYVGGYKFTCVYVYKSVYWYVQI